MWKVVVVSILLGLAHYFVFAKVQNVSESAVYSAKFIAFLFGAYSLIQGRGRRRELNLRRQDLLKANGDPEKVNDVQVQLNHIKKDKETGEMLMVVAFFIILTLSLIGKA